MRRFSLGRHKKEGGKPMELLPVPRFDIDSLMEDFFDNTFSYFRGFNFFRTPAIDVYDSKDDIVVKADLPGLNKDDIDILVQEDTLTIKGEKKKVKFTKSEKREIKKALRLR